MSRNPLEDLTDEDLLGILDRTGTTILQVLAMPEAQRQAQRPKGGGSAEANLFLQAHFFHAADAILQSRGVVA